MKGRILILGTGHLSSNPRVLKEAITLAQSGYSVTVIGKRYLKNLDNTDQSIAKKHSFEYSYIDIIGKAFPSRSYILGWLRRLGVRIARDLVKYINWQSAEALGPASALLRAARKTPADLTIVHNEAAQWVGLQLIAEGRRVAVDFEDWNSEDLLPSGKATRPTALLRQNEKRLLQQACYATTTSEALAEGLFTRYGGQRPQVITNSFPLPALPTHRERDEEDLPSFMWFSQTIGPGRGLEAFLAAYARMTQPSRLTLLGQVGDDYRQHLLALLPAPLRHRIRFQGLVSPEELLDVIAQHDIGLALEESTPPNKDLTISNKILQYLGAGLAVVATPTRGQCEVLSREKLAGILLEDFGDAQATAAALDALLADGDRLCLRQQAARRLAETHYCWELEAPRLLELVERALRD